jgi:hypothetical protein
MWLYYLWTLHYSIAKRAYRSRIKIRAGGPWNLSLVCLIIFFITIILLFSNREFIGGQIRLGNITGPMFGFLAVLILIPIMFLSRGITNKKIKILRKVNRQIKNIKHWHAVLYALFYVAMFLFAMFLLISTIPPVARADL